MLHSLDHFHEALPTLALVEMELPYEGQFDCVYTRSCSLYNSETFGDDQHITDALLRYVKPGGVLVFDYYSKLSTRKRSSTWLYHSARHVEEHFSRYPHAEVHFSLRVDTILLGSLAFSKLIGFLNQFVSRKTGIGGEIVAFVRKP